MNVRSYRDNASFPCRLTEYFRGGVSLRKWDILRRLILRRRHLAPNLPRRPLPPCQRQVVGRHRRLRGCPATLRRTRRSSCHQCTR